MNSFSPHISYMDVMIALEFYHWRAPATVSSQIDQI